MGTIILWTIMAGGGWTWSGSFDQAVDCQQAGRLMQEAGDIVSYYCEEESAAMIPMTTTT